MFSLSNVSSDFINTSIKVSPDQLSMDQSPIQKSTDLVFWGITVLQLLVCFYRAGGGQLSQCAPSLYRGINLVWEFDLSLPDDPLWLFKIFISQLVNEEASFILLLLNYAKEVDNFSSVWGNKLDCQSFCHGFFTTLIKYKHKSCTLLPCYNKSPFVLSNFELQVYFCNMSHSSLFSHNKVYSPSVVIDWFMLARQKTWLMVPLNWFHLCNSFILRD